MQLDAVSAEVPTACPAPISAAADPKPATRGLNILQRLTLMVLVVAAPMSLLSAGIVWRLAGRESDIRQQAMMYSSRSILSAVDAQLGKYVAVAEALAASPSLQNQDLVSFREEAERALPGLSGSWVAVADARGQEVVNTLVAAGTPLPRIPPEILFDEIRAFETKQVQVSDGVIGPVAKFPVIAVGVPVFRDSKPAYYLAIGVNVTVFRDLLDSERVPDGWLAVIMDRTGKFLARSRDHETWVGKPASQGWRAAMNQEGIFDVLSGEGDLLTAAKAISPLSGWVLGVAVQKNAFESPIRQTTFIASVVAFSVTLLSILLAIWVARRIAVPIKAMEKATRVLQQGEPVSLSPTGVPEVDRVLHAFDKAAKALRAHEERRAQTELALKMSEQRLRLFIEQAPASIVMFDREMRYLAVSRRWLDNFNLGEQNVIGRSHYEVLPEIPMWWREKHRRGLNGEVLKEDDDPIVRADGRTQWVRWEIRPWFAIDGSIGGIVIFSDDVTSQHEAAAALKESDERLRLLLYGTKDCAVFMLDPSGRIASWYEGARRITGYDAAEIVDRHFSIFYASDDIAAGGRERELEVALSAGTFETEVEHVQKDGARYWASILTAPIFDESGTLRGFSKIIRDITEQRNAAAALAEAHAEAQRAEREARTAHAHLRDAIEAIPEGLVIFDADDRFVVWNSRYAEISSEDGVNPAVGMHFDQFLRMRLESGDYPEALGREEEWITERLARRSQPQNCSEYKRSDGRWLRVEERRTPDGGSVSVHVDITELKRREASFRLLFEANPVPMWVFDRETLRYIAVNDAAVRHYGYSREQFLDMSPLDIRPPQDRDEVRKLMNTKYGSDRTWRHIKADGTQIEVAVFAQPLRYEGRDASLAAIFDLTQRKQAEDELRRTRTFLKTIIDNVPAVIAVKDVRTSRYLMLNRTGAEMFGVAGEDAVGRTPKELYQDSISAGIMERDRRALAYISHAV